MLPKVVKLWPEGGVYCLGSSHMKQVVRSFLSALGNCVPQAVQMSQPLVSGDNAIVSCEEPIPPCSSLYESDIIAIRYDTAPGSQMKEKPQE